MSKKKVVFILTVMCSWANWAQDMSQFSRWQLAEVPASPHVRMAEAFPADRGAPESQFTKEASTLQPVGMSLDSAPQKVWKDDIGSGFRKHTFEVGIEAGAGLGCRLLGGAETHDIAIGLLQAGFMLSDPVAEKYWFRGNWELVGGAFGGAQLNHRTAYLTGLNFSLRYDFATGTRFVPFIGGGGGPSLTDIGHPDLSTKFEFNLNADLGVHYFFRPDVAATIHYRWIHLSNAGMEKPNQGVNSNLLMVGVNWFF